MVHCTLPPMSLKAKIEAVIYASEEPVTLPQLAGLLGGEAQAELDAADARQGQLALLDEDQPTGAAGDDLSAEFAGEPESDDQDALNAETLGLDEPRLEELAAGGKSLSGDSVLREESAPGHAAAASEGDPAAFENPSARQPSNLAENSQAPEPSPAQLRTREGRLREYMRSVLDALIAEYRDGDRGLEIREVAGGFRFATKPEYHDAVRGFVRSLKPPLKLSLQALETLAVVAYKQPVTAPEVSEIRGVDSGGVLGGLMVRKLVTTAGRKQVIGRPILYKTTKEFLLRFGLKDVAELPGIEEFERMASSLNEALQEEIPMSQTPVVPVGTAAETERMSPEELARELEPSRDEHSAQADGDPNASILTPDEVDDEHLTSGSDGPGEFTGDATVPPADNVAIDGRLSGLPPSYNNANDEVEDSPANDAAVQAEQMENAGSDD